MMEVIYIRGGEVVGAAHIRGIEILYIEPGGVGCLLGIKVADDALWERMYMEYEKLRDYPEYRIEMTQSGVTIGTLDYMDGVNKVMLVAPAKLLVFLRFVIEKGCAWGISDSRGRRAFWIGRPCQCSYLRRLVDVALR
jgi:hypothetical protein